jgi:hypothetical protein
VLFECFKGKDDILGRDGLAVVPSCFRAQPVSNPGKIVWICERLGDQRVCARGFIERGEQKGVIDQVNPRGEVALDAYSDKIEIVVCAG